MATPIPRNDARFSGEELTAATRGRWLGDVRPSVQGVAIDSRHVGVGGLFVAVRGQRVDGHDFAAAALSNGAAAVVCEHELNSIPKANQLLVEDCQRALGDIAHSFRMRWGGSILGITGSAGKTTSKELATVALGGRYPAVASTRGNLNNLFGLPMTILALPASADCAVLEMGTSEQGEIGRLAEIAAPTVGIVTLVSAAHTLGLGSVESIRQEKATLYKHLGPGGVAVANADDSALMKLATEHHQGAILSFGYSKDATVRIVDYGLQSDLRTQIQLQVAGTDEPLSLSVSLLGEPAAMNAAAVIAAGLAFGLDPEHIAGRLEGCPPVPGRLFPVKIGGRFILDDSYNASPKAGFAALGTLATLAKLTDRRPVAILGDMKELGEHSLQAHGELIAEAERLDLARCVLVGPEMAAAARGMNLDDRTQRLVPDAVEVARFIDQWTRDGDLILIKGSRSMKMEQIVERLREAEEVGR